MARGSSLLRRPGFSSSTTLFFSDGGRHRAKAERTSAEVLTPGPERGLYHRAGPLNPSRTAAYGLCETSWHFTLSSLEEAYGITS